MYKKSTYFHKTSENRHKKEPIDNGQDIHGLHQILGKVSRTYICVNEKLCIGVQFPSLVGGGGIKGR